MNLREIILATRKEIKENSQYKSILYWTLCSFIGVMAIKTIRFKHLHLSPIANFLQGTLPNFFAGTGICSLIFIYYRTFQPKKNNLTERIFFSGIFSFAGLTLWEIIQWFMGYSIDIFDIGMTALGCILTSVFIFLVIQKNN